MGHNEHSGIPTAFELESRRLGLELELNAIAPELRIFAARGRFNLDYSFADVKMTSRCWQLSPISTQHTEFSLGHARATQHRS